MHFWPHWPVWPFFLMGAAFLTIWNKPAALVFAAYWIMFQLVKLFGLENPQIIYFFGISLVGIYSFTQVDKVAGGFVCVTATVYACHILGFIDQVPKAIVAELIIATGMLVCGIIGPAGGTSVGSDILSRVGSGYLGNLTNSKLGY